MPKTNMISYSSNVAIYHYDKDSAPVYTRGEHDDGAAHIVLTKDGYVYVDSNRNYEKLQDVVYLRTLTWKIRKNLTGLDINHLLDRLFPLLNEVRIGYSIDSDGKDLVGNLTDTAISACEAIQEICDSWRSSRIVQYADEYIESELFDIYSDWPEEMTLEAFVKEITGDEDMLIIGDLEVALLDHAESVFWQDLESGCIDDPLPSHVVTALHDSGYITQDDVGQYFEAFISDT